MHEMFRRNLGYKIVSIILAILFWLWVTNQNQGINSSLGSNQFTIPLYATNLPANSMVMTKLPTVLVTLQGSNPSVNVKELYAYVDLSGSEPGQREYEIKMDPIPNIKVLEMTPSRVSLELDTVQEKMLPIELNITGKPAEGKEVGDAIIKPNVVNVRGPGTLLASVEKVTVDVNIEGAKETVQVSRPILFRDQSGQAIFGPDPSVTLTANPGSVDVIVPIISKGLGNKMIPLKVLTKGEPAEGMMIRSIQVVPEGVKVFGEPGALDGFDTLNLGPIDLTGIAEDKTFEISSNKVALPSGISYGAPTQFTIIVKVGKAAQNKTFSEVPVAIRNIPHDVVVEQAAPAVNVTVKAVPEVLEKLAADQITLWVDASGHKAGSYSDAKVYWQLPEGVEMVNVPNVAFKLKGK